MGVMVKQFIFVTSGPTMQEIRELIRAAFDPETYRRLYSDFEEQNPLWNEIPTTTGNVYRVGS